MANTISSPRPTRQLYPEDFLAIRRLMRDTDRANAANDEMNSDLLRTPLGDRPDHDDVFWEIEAYNRRLQYILLMNTYLLGREARNSPEETNLCNSRIHALPPLPSSPCVMPDNVLHRV